MPDLGLCPSPEGNTFGQEENQVEMMDIRIPPILTEKGKNATFGKQVKKISRNRAAAISFGKSKKSF